MKKLAIVTTHPIQYNAPMFQLLKERNNIDVKVFYTWGEAVVKNKYDPGFGREVEWDIPLLNGYPYSFVANTATKKGSHHFNGIINPGLIKEIEDWKADAILVFGWSFKSHLRVMRYFKGKKAILFRGDSNLLDSPGGFIVKKVKKIFLKWVYKNVDIALYAGSANKNYFLEYGLKKEQLIFAPHAVANERFIKATGKSMKGKFGIPDRDVVFLFAGKLEGKKDPVLLLEAFSRLNMENTHLLMVGVGHLEATLKAKISEKNASIRNRIHLLGFQNQSAMPAIYQTADILVLPSRGPGETWGLAVNEAMAASLPVLVSDKVGCHIDLVKDGVNGYVFESGNIDDLHNKMKRMAADPARLANMGRESLHIIHDWSFTNIAVAIEQAMSYI